MPCNVLRAYIYPVKSCRGIEVPFLEFDTQGPLYDRRWMLVDAQNRALTQRQNTRLAHIETSLSQGKVVVSYPGMPDLSLEPSDEGVAFEVPLWKSVCQVIDQGKEAREWFSSVVQEPCQLVRMHPEHRRAAKPDGETVFADGYPLLVISEASLEDLNARLAAPVPMDRFRPNLVVGGTMPYEEDFWKEFQIGAMRFSGIKLCSRCVMTTVDQKTLQRSKEPLATLAAYRNFQGKIVFGQNVLHRGQGKIEVGDAIDILERWEVPPLSSGSKEAV